MAMPDTPANQAAYPQPRSQKPGLGFPLCRMVGIVCLGSGAVLNAATGVYRGQGGNEQALLRSMLDTLESGDVLLRDAYFATYFLLCRLREQGVDAVFEQHGSRQRCTDFRRGQRLGARDHLIVLDKPKIRPDWMSRADYEQAPDALTVRKLRVHGDRPGRIEPRAIKRRPKPFPLLTQLRELARAHVRIHGHPKKLKNERFSGHQP